MLSYEGAGMKRRLSIHFERSVSGIGNRPEILEVMVTPLNSSNHPAGDSTFAALKQVKKVRLANAKNTVVFELEPTFSPGLTQPIYYRIAWRRGFGGRIEEHDFSMPDRDCDWDDIKDLGEVIGGENYLKEEDLGVPGRVARLDPQGRVLDGNGLPVATTDIGPITAALEQEVRDRVAGDADVDRRITLRLNNQINSLTNTLDTRFASEAGARTAAVATERQARIDGDAALSASLDSRIGSVTNTVNTLRTRVDGHDTTLAGKADLVDGKIPTSQIPAIALSTAIPVEDETEMLALTPQQVQKGDIAVRPDGNWILVGDAITDIGSWVKLSSSGGSVDSVNGQVGAVVLTAADLGARPLSQSIPQADVTGLIAALNSKASTASVTNLTGQLGTTNTNVTNLTGRVSTAEGSLASLTADYTAHAVKTNESGEIPSSVIGADIVRVDSEGTLRRKDGTVIAVSGGGGEGGGAVSSVNNKVGAVVLTAADVGARPSGSPVPLAEVDGLLSALDGKASLSALQSTNTRVGRAESDITDIKSRLDDGETGGGNGGGGSTRHTISWVADDESNPSLVTMRSPFGIDSTGIPYYDPDGAMEGEGAYPYVSMYGNLVLRKLDPHAPPEPEWGTKAQIDAVASRVTTLETSTDDGYQLPLGGIPAHDLEQPLQDAYANILGATSSADPDTLVLRSATGTFSASPPTAESHVATMKYVTEQVATRASASALTSLTTTVNSKANSADLAALTSRVGQTESALSLKADLDSSSLVPVTQIPTLPGAKVSGFNLKADLDGVSGKIPVSQIPTGIPLGSISNLSATLSAKADLVGGKIPTSQIPSLAIGDTEVVANRAAMLALSPAQVQRGDIAIVTDTQDKGTYRLTADDPSVFANWVKLSFGGSGTVESVNGQTGIVMLGAADVGARPAGTAIPQSEVTGLASAIGAKADVTYVDTQVATRATPAQVTAAVAAQSVSKQAAEFVATTPVASLSGSQTIDGTLVGAGRRVLLTGQSASSQNGLWVTASGAWTRTTDMSDGSTFVPSTLVSVTNGAAHADSIWQITTANPGVVGTNANNWAKVLRGGLPKTYTGGNGITIDGSGVVAARAGAGIIVDSSGIRLDTAVSLRRMAVDVPGGSTTVTIPHTFGHADLLTDLRETSSGNKVLAGITVTSSNIIIEFGVAPTTGQWRLTAIG